MIELLTTAVEKNVFDNFITPVFECESCNWLEYMEFAADKVEL